MVNNNKLNPKGQILTLFDYDYLFSSFQHDFLVNEHNIEKYKFEFV